MRPPTPTSGLWSTARTTCWSDRHDHVDAAPRAAGHGAVLMTGALEDLLRELAPQVLGALVRRYGHFDIAEDAVQEALLAAAQQWPDGGVPDSPRGWLITVASRRLTDLLRREQARQRREDRVAQWTLPGEPVADTDDTLVLLFMCCHPSLSPASQIALTLRAVGGLTTTEIARAFLVPEATMTRRITRAKARVKESGARFTLPADRGRAARCRLAGRLPDFQRGLCEHDGAEPATGRVVGRGHPVGADAAPAAARRQRGDGLAGADVADRCPSAGAVGSARGAGPDGRAGPVALDPAAHRGGRRADHRGTSPRAGRALSVAGRDRGGARRVAVSAEEPTGPRSSRCTRVLLQLSDNPMVALNHVVAVAMARGPDEGLELLASIEDDDRIAKDHRLSPSGPICWRCPVTRRRARAAYEEAASRTTSLPQQRYLHTRASRL